MYCKNCGKELADNAVMCPNCGAPTQNNIYYNGHMPKNWLVALLLCAFLGEFGIHRFYVGKTVTGILQLITCGGCLIWTIIDFFLILFGAFRDSDGRPLSR